LISPLFYFILYKFLFSFILYFPAFFFGRKYEENFRLYFFTRLCKDRDEFNPFENSLIQSAKKKIFERKNLVQKNIVKRNVCIQFEFSNREKAENKIVAQSGILIIDY
jgi:hypothetical protein